MIDLRAIIENEWFIVCDLLPSDHFITPVRQVESGLFPKKRERMASMTEIGWVLVRSA